MKRILVPTDFSIAAEKAFRFAVNIAEKTRGTVILYHSCIPVESIFIDTEQERKQYNTQVEASTLNRLESLRKTVTGNSTDVTISTIVGRSPLVDNIIAFAKHNKIDLIIMGTQGASGLKKTIIGSVAARIIEISEMPVLLIPEKYQLKEPGKLIFATNYHTSDKQALMLVDSLAKLYNATITVLHFLSVYTADSEKRKERTDFDDYALSMQKVFPHSQMSFNLLETYSVIETLEKLDCSHPYDIMAMVRRNKTFLEKFFIKSLTQNMAYVTTKPLLIVPDAHNRMVQDSYPPKSKQRILL